MALAVLPSAWHCCLATLPDLQSPNPDTGEHRRDGSWHLGGEGSRFFLVPKSVLREGAGGAGQAEHHHSSLFPIAAGVWLRQGMCCRVLCTLQMVTDVKQGGRKQAFLGVCPASVSLPVSPYKPIPAWKSASRQRLFKLQEVPSHG